MQAHGRVREENKLELEKKRLLVIIFYGERNEFQGL